MIPGDLARAIKLLRIGVEVRGPGFLGSQGALTAAGAQLVPVVVDSEGMQVDSTCSARMAVVTRRITFRSALP